MSRGIEVLRPDIRRALNQLNALPAGSVIVDQYGHAWQYGSVGHDVAWWYRAYDGDGISSWELAQRAKSVGVVHRPEPTTTPAPSVTPGGEEIDPDTGYLRYECDRCGSATGRDDGYGLCPRCEAELND